MRQPSADRALYYRQIRRTIATELLPDLTSAQAIDAAGLLDRILAEFIVEEEEATELSAEFGRAFEDLLDPTPADPPASEPAERPPVTPDGFVRLRERAAEEVARTAGPAPGDEVNPDAATTERAHQLVEVERRFLERVESLRAEVLADRARDGDDPPPDPTQCSVTKDQVTDYFRRRLPRAPGIEVEALTVVPGGRSKETVLVSLRGDTGDFPSQVILRKDRPVGLLQTEAADEFAVIEAVHGFGGVPIPEPFFVERGDHGLGPGTFLVMERVPGHKAGEFFPDLAAPADHQRQIGLQVAVALARLHSMPLERLTHTHLDPVPPAVTPESIAAMVEGMVSRINGLSGPPCVTVPLARRWLLDHVADVVPATRLCLLQGDFGFHNMLVDGGRVTALVDWEGAAIGPPARELASAWSAATTLMDWPGFVEAYIGGGGNPEDADQRAVNFYRVFLALGGFMTSRMGGDLFRTGAKRDLLTAHSGLDSHFRCARNLARALGDAMAQP
jgi:aminoglycoside phosphotransferase (APT) family kinase protein